MASSFPEQFCLADWASGFIPMGYQPMKNHLTRRGFIRRAAVGSAALTWLGSRHPPMAFAGEANKPALLGGVPVHQGGWSEWPKRLESWEPAVVQVLRSGTRLRGYGGHGAVLAARQLKQRRQDRARMPTSTASPKPVDVSVSHSATCLVSLPRIPSISPPAKAAPSLATAMNSWTGATRSTTSDTRPGASRALSSSLPEAATIGCSSSRL